MTKVVWRVVFLGGGVFAAAGFRGGEQGPVIGYVKRRFDGDWGFVYNGVDDEVYLSLGVKRWAEMHHAMLAVQEYFEQETLEGSI